MPAPRCFFAAALATLAFAVSPAHAGVSDSCASFTVIGQAEGRTVSFVDVGGNGEGPGDQRIGRRTVVDTSGNAAGYVRWIGTVLNLPGDDGTDGEIRFEYTLVLDDGQILYTGIDAIQNPAKDTTQVSAAGRPSAIIGGTGAYAAAQGTVETVFENLVSIITVNPACDD